MVPCLSDARPPCKVAPVQVREYNVVQFWKVEHCSGRLRVMTPFQSSDDRTQSWNVEHGLVTQK
jgi:hypothetical protein